MFISLDLRHSIKLVCYNKLNNSRNHLVVARIYNCTNAVQED